MPNKCSKHRDPELIGSSYDWAHPTVSEHIQARIKDSIKEQVEFELGVQIRQHLPDSLEDQVRESRKQIESVKVALRNS